MFLVWVWFKVKSQSSFETMKIWYSMTLIRIIGVYTHFVILIKLDKEKTKSFDSNHFLHLIQIIFMMSTSVWFDSTNFEHDSNHILFKLFPVRDVSFDLNQFLHMIRMIWIMIRMTWLMIQITLFSVMKQLTLFQIFFFPFILLLLLIWF